MRISFTKIITGIYYSFPVQLLGVHLKKNLVLLIPWAIFFLIIIGEFGRSLGIPYLFLDPEYMGKVDFTSFFIMGVVVSVFSISFIITTYIFDALRFNFLAWFPMPFSRYSLNNAFIPLIFLGIYSIKIIEFQQLNGASSTQIFYDMAGLYLGFIVTTTLMFVYFRLTNKDIFKYVVCKLDENIKQKVPASRASAMRKVAAMKKKQIRVDNFLNFNFRFVKVPDYTGFYDRSTLIQVFDQNHLNLVIVELFIFVVLFVLGLFSDQSVFQIPAAASAMLFLTIFVMLAGAFSYWFRGWSITIFIVLVIVVNLLVRFEVITKKYYAFGLDYDSEPIEYSLATIEAHNTEEHVKEDILQTISILDNWKSKFQSGEKPKIVFVSASGGGQRAALWTINALQKIDSATQGNFMESTILITGASGGLIGASYYRDLLLLHKENKELNLKNPQYLDNIAKDNLNPIIFNLLVNDFFMGFQKFEYQGKFYTKDRGYAFEQQLNKNTEGVMDRAISAYRIPEIENKIPMMILAPTIMNDGRKLYISPQHISYMNSSFMSEQIIKTEEVKGIEFLSYFKDHGAEDLRMLSALRMSATFPYITPNITLPSNPRMEIMDAGVTDNFGISDGVKFLHTFREWIEDNTSGVIFVSIRDSQKNQPVEPEKRESMFQKMFSPLNGLYSNFERIQDINNDTKLEMAQTWFKKPIYRITMEYNSANNQVIKDRASLNWRLTTREKKSIISNIYSSKNQIEIEKIVKHLQKNKLKGAEELNPETRIEE